MANQNLKLTIQFFREEPVAAARKLDVLDVNSTATLIQKVPVSIVAKVINAMMPSAAANLLRVVPEVFCGTLFQSLELADIASILRYINETERNRLIALLPKNRQALARLLISYPENTVGALIETNVLVLDSQMTVEESLLRIKKQVGFDTHEVFVVNAKRKMVGRVSVFDLIKTSQSAPVSTLVKSGVETINGLTDVSTALALDCWNKADSIAVVNRKQEFIGLLRHYDLRSCISRSRKSADTPYSAGVEVMDSYSEVLHMVTELFVKQRKVE